MLLANNNSEHTLTQKKDTESSWVAKFAPGEQNHATADHRGIIQTPGPVAFAE